MNIVKTTSLALLVFTIFSCKESKQAESTKNASQDESVAHQEASRNKAINNTVILAVKKTAKTTIKKSKFIH